MSPPVTAQGRQMNRAITLRKAIRKREAEDGSPYTVFVSSCRRAGSRNLIGEMYGALHVAAMRKKDADIAAAMQQFRIRPVYTAGELSAMWPLICAALHPRKRVAVRVPGAVDLRRSLLKRGLPLLTRPNGSTHYEWRGAWREFFIVSDIAALSSVRWTQDDFEKLMG